MKTVRNFLNKSISIWQACLLAVLACVLACAIQRATAAPQSTAAVKPITVTQDGIDSLRLVATKLDEDITGAQAWLVKPMRDHGVTSNDLLTFCDYLEEHFID